MSYEFLSSLQHFLSRKMAPRYFQTQRVNYSVRLSERCYSKFEGKFFFWLQSCFSRGMQRSVRSLFSVRTDSSGYIEKTVSRP